MTTSEKIENVKARANDQMCTDAVAQMLLDDAQEAIFQRMYPFGVPDDVTDVPARYQLTQCKLAARYFFRIGSEGEAVHLENGIHRHYGSVNDDDLLMEVMQVIAL
jgi:hypothetical protein